MSNYKDRDVEGQSFAEPYEGSLTVTPNKNNLVGSLELPNSYTNRVAPELRFKKSR